MRRGIIYQLCKTNSSSQNILFYIHTTVINRFFRIILLFLLITDYWSICINPSQVFKLLNSIVTVRHFYFDCLEIKI